MICRWESKYGLLRCIQHLPDDIPDKPQYKETHNKEEIMQEYTYLINFIEGLNIPIEVSHWDTSPRNMLYNRETGDFWLVDYETVNTEIFTHDLAMYFVAAKGTPADFGNLPSDEVMKQFLKCYIEEKNEIQGRPLQKALDEEICEILYWTKVSILFICFMFYVGGPVWMTRCAHLPAHIDYYGACLDNMKHYYRMKKELMI